MSLLGLAMPVVGGGGGGAVAAADITDATAAGRALLTAATAAAQRTALALDETPSLASTSGWTTTAGAGASSIVTASSLARQTLALGAGGAGASGLAYADCPRVTRPHGRDTILGLDVRAKCVFSSADTNAYATLGLVQTDGNGIQLALKGDGNVYLGTVAGGVFTSVATVSGATPATRTWLRLRTYGQTVVAYHTAVASPTAADWVLVGSATLAAPATLALVVMMLDAANSGPAAAFTLDWSDVMVIGGL